MLPALYGVSGCAEHKRATTGKKIKAAMIAGTKYLLGLIEASLTPVIELSFKQTSKSLAGFDFKDIERMLAASLAG